MSSDPQVTTTTATQNSTARVLTRRQADLLPVYDVVGRWLYREPAFLHEDEPEHHLEELALMTVSAEWLTRWQPISMHRALLAGATPEQVAEAAGTSVRGMFEQWKQWADGQRRSLIAGRPGVSQEAYETIRHASRQPAKNNSRRSTYTSWRTFQPEGWASAIPGVNGTRFSGL